MPLYSIGYQRLTPDKLVRVMDRVGARTLIDVRGKPVSRKKGFSRRALEELLGDRYQWAGDTLGGPGGGTTVQPEGIEMLAKMAGKMKKLTDSAIIMCLEESPASCHRHQHIAVPLLEQHDISVFHILENEVIESGEVQRWLDDGAKPGDYEWEDLWEHYEPAAVAAK